MGPSDDPSWADSLGAFVPGPRSRLPPLGLGPLSGLDLAVKDLFDLAGFVTGCGNPDWAATHPPASATAPVVETLRQAGAAVVGKTITDELAFSLSGENAHYGTPANVNAPGRIPGGSSSGSASAVAGGMADIALGTDTGGSIRIPASYCGLFGLRPSHGRIAPQGLQPLAPSLDAIGWFAREAEVLARVGSVLLGEDSRPRSFRRLLWAEDAWALATAETQAALLPWRARLEGYLGKAEPVPLGGPEGLESWMLCFRAVQAAEAAGVHRDWVERVHPRFGPEIQERIAWALSFPPAQAAAAREQRPRYRAYLEALLGEEALLLLPTAPGPAPKLKATSEAVSEQRQRVLCLTSPAGLSGFPQVTLPLARSQGFPLGLSLLGPPGSDRALLTFVQGFCAGLA